MFGLGPGELLILLLILLLLFGAKKVPELMRGVGLGVKEFRKASKEPLDEAPTSPLEQES